MKATLYAKVNNALLTPKIAGSIGFIIFAVFSQAVLPKYEQMYAESGIEMPELVQTFVSVSNSFFHYWYITLIMLYGFYKFWKWFCSTKRDVVDSWKLKLWVYKDLHIRLIQHEFATYFGLLLGAGILPAEACELVSRIVSNSVMGKNIRAAGNSATAGTTIPLAFSKHNEQGTFGPMLLSFLKIGTTTGMLPAQMERAARVYELEINSKIDSVEKKLLLIILTPMGFLIFGMYAMSLVPMIGYFQKISGL